MRWSGIAFLVLCVSMIGVSAIFGVPHQYSQPVRMVLIILGLAAVFGPALLLGATLAKDSRSRVRGIAGLALVAPVGLFAFLPGFGPPDAVSASENYFRYIILLAGSVCLGAGLLLLSEVAQEDGSAVLGRVARTTALLATPLYIIWATVLVQIVTIMSLPGYSATGTWLRWVSDWSDIVLFAAGVLSYLCAAALSGALLETRLIGRGLAIAFGTISLLAAALLLMRGLRFPSPADAFRHWYAIPGWIAGIPAVPWMVPAFMGAVCLRGRSSERRASA
jgi:hypothetical protein